MFYVLSLVSLQTTSKTVNDYGLAILANTPYANSYRKTKTAPSDSPNKSHTQQKRQPLMPYEKNGTLQKWHMTNTHLKQTNIAPKKNGVLQKRHNLRKDLAKLFDMG